MDSIFPCVGRSCRGADAALIRLSEEVVGIDPAVRYTSDNLVGEEGVMVGYGYGGVGSTGYDSTTPMIKRGATNTIDYVGKNGKLLYTDFDSPDAAVNAIFDNPLGSDDPTDLEGSLAPGDSGGGLFVDVGGEYQLAGINSFVFGSRRHHHMSRWGRWGRRPRKSISDYGDVSGFTSVAELNDWIDEMLELDSFEDANGAHWDCWGRWGFGGFRRHPWDGRFVTAELAAVPQSILTVEDAALSEPAVSAEDAAVPAPLAGAQTAHVPEPSAFVLAAIGMIGLLVLGWRKRPQ